MNEQVINVLSKKWVIPTAVGVTSFGSGLVAGYFWGKRNGTVNIDLTDLEAELIDSVREFDPNQLMIEWEEHNTNLIPSHVMNKADYVQMMSVAEDIQIVDEEEEIPWELEEEAEELLAEDELEEAIAEQAHKNLITDDGDNLPEVKNVFDNNDQWDYESELSIRSADRPYIITIDEFVADEAGCDQSTVTYYAGDDIMANEHDIPLYDYNGMMGELKFGHGSNDPTVVYIRNEKLNMEWEVLHHQGRFDIEVLGHDIEDAYAQRELKHSVPRFRDE